MGDCLYHDHQPHHSSPKGNQFRRKPWPANKYDVSYSTWHLHDWQTTVHACTPKSSNKLTYLKSQSGMVQDTTSRSILLSMHCRTVIQVFPHDNTKPDMLQIMSFEWAQTGNTCRPHQIAEQICSELWIQQHGFSSMWSSCLAVLMQSSEGKEVDVEPNWASPVGSIMLSVVHTMNGAAQTERPTLHKCWVIMTTRSHILEDYRQSAAWLSAA